MAALAVAAVWEWSSGLNSPREVTPTAPYMFGISNLYGIAAVVMKVIARIPIPKKVHMQVR